MTSRPRLVALALVALLAGGCATPHPGAQAPKPAGELPFETCAEWTTLEADPSFYRDEPVYGLDDQPSDLLDEAVAWARGHDGFTEAWYDHENLGWIHLGFTGDVDTAALQDELEHEFPGEGVVVVHLPFSTAELSELAERADEVLRAAGATYAGLGMSAPMGKVYLDAVAPDPATIEALAAFAGEPLCVDLLPEDSLIPEGPQASWGEGWRLLGAETGVGDVYRTGIATNETQLGELWALSGLSVEPGEVDWQTEVVLWFGAVYGSSCPVRLDDVLVTGSVLHGEIVVPGWPGACTADANPHSFVVAVERSELPAPPFFVQLDAEEPPPGAPEERTTVEVDLREPGAEL